MMNEILRDLSEPALINAIEENLFAFHPYFLGWSRSGGQTSPKLLWNITDIPFPLFNYAFNARFMPEDADREIEVVIARGRSRKVPLLWFIGPSTTPADLGQYLIAHGFVHDGDSPGMAADLHKLQDDRAEVPHLTITPVKDIESLKIWCDILVAGYGMPESVGPAFLDWFSSFRLDPQMPLRHYIGWWNGKPSAIASMLLAAGTAGVYNITTLPEARGKGIGSAMTLTPLLEARAEGVRVGVLQSTAQGFPVYRKLGFQEYCSIGSYVLDA
ncbi:MAG: GNAT family N-acetyltransferase [Deltaproteobacteria bacterium]|nr:GNAT family N-acetyltransferase [Deltaproteobacteria bacterium]